MRSLGTLGVHARHHPLGARYVCWSRFYGFLRRGHWVGGRLGTLAMGPAQEAVGHGLGEGHHLTPDALATSKVSAASVLDLSCNECGRRPVVWACE